MEISLVGKNALVGGGSAGIGQAVAQELALLGANVTILARNATNLAKTLEELDTKLGQVHQFIAVDFNDFNALQEKASTLASLQTIHILVNNTGGPPGGAIIQATSSDFLAAYENHLLCNHLLATTFLPGMIKAGYGRIINVISTSVKEPIEGLGVSNTTRWAVASWAKTLASEVGKYGITVNNVLPGFTKTGRLDEIINKKAVSSGESREKIEAAMITQVPLNRFALAQEIAAGVVFLASPAAGYITGINLPIDGGRTKSL